MEVIAKKAASGRADEAVSESAVMARSLGWLYIAGATIGLSSVLLPRASHANVGALLVNIELAYFGGLILLVGFRRLPRWALHVVLLAGTVIITRAIYYSGAGNSYYAIWYLWLVVFACSFFRRGHAAGHVALVGLAYATRADLCSTASRVAHADSAVLWEPRAGRTCARRSLLAAQAASAIERVGLLARLERIAHTDELTDYPTVA